MSLLNLEIISPTEIIFSGSCKTAVIPAQEGVMGVLHNHEIFVTSLKQGEIIIYNENDEVIKNIKTDGGFAKMSDKLLILITAPIN
jgi:F0F1-type ATP synthase epsilon subunit